MSVKHQIFTAFSTVDTDNVHVAIASQIAADLWERHPNVHFQAIGPAKGEREALPGHSTAAAVTFKFARPILYCGKTQDINHFGTITIDRGACHVKVTDPATSSYNEKAYLIDREWPLEFPKFPEVVYDQLQPFLSEAVGDPKLQSKTAEYLYEVKCKQMLRHLVERIDKDPFVALCGQKLDRSRVVKVAQSVDFTHDGQYCGNCTESRIFKKRRGEL